MVPTLFPETPSVTGYNDVTPRVGVSYDVFGKGKTSIKVNIGKYLQAATNDENYWANNPAGRIVTAVGLTGGTQRPWTDGNKNMVVDCDLSNPLLQNNLATGGDSCAAKSEATATDRQRWTFSHPPLDRYEGPAA